MVGSRADPIARPDDLDAGRLRETRRRQTHLDEPGKTAARQASICSLFSKGIAAPSLIAMMPSPV